MCLIAFAIDADPTMPLLIASNRDEHLDRPTAPLHRWMLPNGVEVVAGRDLKDGGTWLGANALGRVAMLTNVRTPNMAPARLSRGALANTWLAGEVSWPELLSSLDPSAYGGFNLVVGDATTQTWGWVSNRAPQTPHDDTKVALHSQDLAPGVYGLSNATLDSGWPKSLLLKQALQDALDEQKLHARHNWCQPLQQVLGDTRPADLDRLPQTGLAPELEHALSCPFVQMPSHRYATRSSMLLRAVKDPSQQQALGWRIDIEEWTHGETEADQGVWRDDQRQAFTLAW